MENVILGIITILVCSLSYFYSWKYYKQDQEHIALFLIVLSGVLLYLFTSADFFLHEWDERYHGLVAKNLIKHPLHPTLYDNPILPYNYQVWIANHTWLHKQPLPLWLMAGSMKAFGVNEIALRLPSIIMSGIAIILTYRIGKNFYSGKVGLLAAFLFSINGLIIEQTSGRVATDHIDITFMFFILLAIYLSTVYVHRKSIFLAILIGVSIGAALLTKWLAGLIVLPIWLLLVLAKNPKEIKTTVTHFALILTAIALVALPWQIYIFKEFPLEAFYESTFNLRHFTEVIENQSGSALYFIDQIRINYGELIYLPLLWFLWTTFKSPKLFKPLALVVWFLVPIIIFSIAKTKMQGYLLFTAPALFIITSAFFFELQNLTVNHKQKWIINLVLVLLIILPIRYGIERIKPFQQNDRNPEWVVDLKELNKENIQNGILFNYKNPIEAMFYTDLIVYHDLPSKEKIQELINDGYEVLVNDDGVNIKSIQNIDGVKTIKLAISNN